MTDYKKLRHKDKRPRENLEEEELRLVLKASQQGRHGVRDHAICLFMVCHALRASELCGLRLDRHLKLDNSGGGVLYVERLKGSEDTQNIVEPEPLLAVKRWLKIRRKRWGGDHVFVSERGEPLTRQALFYLVKTWGERAFLPFSIHPHMLRHTTGHLIASQEDNALDSRLLQDFMGHKDIRNTVKYTKLSPAKFKGIWGGMWG